MNTAPVCVRSKIGDDYLRPLSPTFSNFLIRRAVAPVTGGLGQYPIYALKNILQIPRKQIALRREEFSGAPAAHEYLHCA